MKKEVPINEVREELAKYLAEAERGNEIIITKHKKPIAKLVSYKEKERPRIPDMSEFRKRITVEGKPMSEFVSELRNEERF